MAETNERETKNKNKIERNDAGARPFQYIIPSSSSQLRLENTHYACSKNKPIETEVLSIPWKDVVLQMCGRSVEVISLECDAPLCWRVLGDPNIDPGQKLPPSSDEEDVSCTVRIINASVAARTSNGLC